MSIVHITDHQQRAVDELCTELKKEGALDLSELMRAFTQEIQTVEDLVQDIIVQVVVDTAIGVQLDTIGELVRQNREGLSDEDYRPVIKIRIRANRGNGHINTITSVLQALTGADSVRYQQIGTAAYFLEFFTDAVVDPTLIAISIAIMNDMRPAGVGLGSIVQVGSGTFRYDDGPGFDVGTYGEDLNV